MTDAVPFLMRDAETGDVAFIVSGWVKEMRHSPWTRHIPNAVYYAAQHELVHRLLAESNAVVACNRDNPEHLFGCVVFDHFEGGEPFVHWLYVKGAYRGLGHGRELLRHAFRGVPHQHHRTVCTQASKLFDDAELVKRYGIVYSPYLLLGIPLPSAAPEDAAASEHANG